MASDSMTAERLEEIRERSGLTDIDSILTLTRDDVPWLLALVEEQRTELERLRKAFNAVLRDLGCELVGDEIRRLPEETSHAT